MRTLLAGLATASMVFGLSIVVSPGPAAALPDGLARTPPMGFNNWARYECNINESIIVRNADALVSTGLAAKGYNTVTVDDCWMTMSRDGNGNLVADTNKFPHGMAWLGQYLGTDRCQLCGDDRPDAAARPGDERHAPVQQVGIEH